MTNTGEHEASLSAGSAYQFSFGDLPNHTTYTKVDLKSYSELKYEVDLRPALHNANLIGMKALSSTTGGAGTAGFALVPIYVDSRITDITRKYTPLVELTPRETNQGTTADYNRITAKGGAFTAGEDAALPETNTTYQRQSKAIKYLYSVGRVTGVAIAAIPSYVLGGIAPQGGAVGPFVDQAANNAKQQEVLIKTREIRELEENLIVNGDSGSDSTQFDGFLIQIGLTNTVAKGGGALGLDDINAAVQLAYDDGGRPNLAVCGSAVYTDLLDLLTAKIGYLQPQQQVFWGFSTIVLHTMVGDIPVIPSMFMSNVSSSKSIYFLDMSVVSMRVLQDLTYQNLAQTNDSEKFMLKIYETYVVKAPEFCSSVTGIL